MPTTFNSIHHVVRMLPTTTTTSSCFSFIWNILGIRVSVWRAPHREYVHFISSCTSSKQYILFTQFLMFSNKKKKMKEIEIFRLMFGCMPAWLIEALVSRVCAPACCLPLHIRCFVMLLIFMFQAIWCAPNESTRQSLVSHSTDFWRLIQFGLPSYYFFSEWLHSGGMHAPAHSTNHIYFLHCRYIWMDGSLDGWMDDEHNLFTTLRSVRYIHFITRYDDIYIYVQMRVRVRFILWAAVLLWFFIWNS